MGQKKISNLHIVTDIKLTPDNNNNNNNNNTNNKASPR